MENTFDCIFSECDEASARVNSRARLVEGDVTIHSNPEQEEVDTTTCKDLRAI